MEGAGNDFILIDNRGGRIPDGAKADMAARYCHRRFGIGADGMIFVQRDREFDFAWDFYNSDGSHAEMCGNGARCVTRFANKIGAAGDHMVFRSLVGPIKSEVTGRGAKVQLTTVVLPNGSMTLDVNGAPIKFWLLNTGVPHAVVPVEDLEKTDVRKLGAFLRHHGHFSPSGTNVNFIRLGDGDCLAIRTYERGVEDETLACGTGSVAATIIAAKCFGKKSPVTVRTRGGCDLVIHFTLGANEVTNVFLEGTANLVFTGCFETAF